METKMVKDYPGQAVDSLSWLVLGTLINCLWVMPDFYDMLEAVKNKFINNY